MNPAIFSFRAVTPARTWIAACALALFGLSACSGDDSDATAAATSGTGGGGGSGGGASCPAGSHPGADDSCEADLAGWAEGPSLKHRRDHHVTLVAETPSGPFLYVAAGVGTVAPAVAVERSAIAEDGTLAGFEDIAQLPEGLIGPGIAQVDRSFVLAGGLASDSNSSTSTYVGAILDDGGVTFTKGPDLSASRYHLTAAYARGFVFAIGGLFQDVSSGTPTQEVEDTIERAAFDGTTLSAFETLAPLPAPLTHHATVVYNDAIYVIGGGSGAAAQTDILRATVSETGDLGTWEAVGQLPEGRATSSALVFLDHLYVIAGMTSLVSGEKPTVLRAPIDAAGAVGTFEELAPLPMARAHSHQTPLYNGHLYSAGGSIMHDPQAEVFVGTLE